MRIDELTTEKLASIFDHTYLKPNATCAEIKKLCDEAKSIGTAMVAINPYWCTFCKNELKDTNIHVGAAIAFPLGQTSIETKVFESEDSIQNGADEIDYVVNISKVKEKDWTYIEEEMRRISETCHRHGAICKVIFENCYLEKEEIQKLAQIAKKVQPDYIKTSTGFGMGGATVEDVALMKRTVGDAVKVKAAGGIRSWQSCREMIEAGAERIGTSSSLKILQEYCDEKNNQTR